MRYRIREISVASVARLGFVLGTIVGVLPSLFDTLFAAWVAGRLYAILSQLSQVTLIPGSQAEIARRLNLGGLIDFSLVDASPELQRLMQSLGALTGPRGWLIYILLFVVGILLTGALWAGLGALAAWAYNALSDWTKGLEVTLEQAVAKGVPAVPQRAAPRPALPGQVQPAAPPPAYVPAQPPPAQPAARVPAQPLPAQPASPRPAAGPPAQALSEAVPAVSGTGPRLALASDPTKVWQIKDPVFTVGSAPGSHLCSASLLPQHAEIRFDPGLNAYILYDLSNGQAWVNNRPVQKVNKLNDGFRVRLGASEFIFRS